MFELKQYISYLKNMLYYDHLRLLIHISFLFWERKKTYRKGPCINYLGFYYSYTGKCYACSLIVCNNVTQITYSKVLTTLLAMKKV